MPLQLTEEETKEHVQGGGKVCATCDTFLPAKGQLFMSRWLFFALKWLHTWRQGRKQDVAVSRSSVQRHTHLWHFCAATDQTLYKFHCILKKITRGGKLQNRNASSLYLSKCFHVFVLYSGIYSYFDSLNLNTNISSFYSLHLHKLECIWGELYIIFLILLRCTCTCTSQHHKTDFYPSVHITASRCSVTKQRKRRNKAETDRDTGTRVNPLKIACWSHSHFLQTRQPVCAFYLKCYVVRHWHHVSLHEYARNKCNRRENNKMMQTIEPLWKKRL